MAFGSQMDNGIRTMLGKNTHHCGAIADIRLHKTMTRGLGPGQIGQIIGVSGIRQHIDIDHHQGRVAGQKMAHQVGTDETHPPCYQSHAWDVRGRL